MADERKTGVNIPTWAIGIIFALVSSLFTGGILWGQARADIDTLKKSVDGIAIDSKAVTEHKAIIPTIQQDVRDLKSIVKSMSEKQDRQYEDIMRAIRQ